jgi:hypothetical protein
MVVGAENGIGVIVRDTLKEGLAGLKSLIHEFKLKGVQALACIHDFTMIRKYRAYLAAALYTQCIALEAWLPLQNTCVNLRYTSMLHVLDCPTHQQDITTAT